MSDNNFIEQLESLGKSLQSLGTSLHAEEKRKMRNALLFAMREFPVHENAPVSRSGNIFAILRNAIAGTVIAGLLGGTVAYAAEGALPGDWLYPVKTEVNERVSTALAVSTETKAEVHAKLAERRLIEAEKLAHAGRLDAKTQVKIAERFASHAEKSESNIQKVEASENLSLAAGIRSDFESVLQAHTRVLARIDAKTPEGRAEMDAILGDVRSRLENITEARTSVEAKITAVNGEMAIRAAEEARTNAKNKIEEIKKYLEGRKAELSPEAQAQVQAQMAPAEKAFEEGELNLSVSSYANAFAHYKRAIREAQGAKLLMRAAEEFAIEINGEINGIHATGTMDVDQEIKLPNGKVQIKKGKIHVEAGNDHGTTSIKVNVGGNGSSMQVYSSSSASSSGGNASVQVNQKIQVNSSSKIQVGF